ncbi:MAG: glycosyltransferase family 4 protein [Candidatus Omnitrophota bacterium]
MNILYLTNHLNVGGITSYLLTLSSGLMKRGHNLYVASSAGELLPKFTKAGVNFIHIPIRTKNEISPKILASAFKLKSVIRREKIDLVHSHSRTTQVLGVLLYKFYALAHISTCHGFFKARFSRRLFPCWGQKVIAISEPVRDHLIKDFKVNERDIIVIHNGIDLERFSWAGTQERAEKKREFGLGDGPVVGIVARLADIKGHLYLIRAMKQVLERVADARLLIIGEGRMYKKLVDLSKTLGIDNSVEFIPKLSDTRDAFLVIDIFAMPSLKEGLGLSIMEAMACGLAVVACGVGGITSLINDQVNGLLVEPANVDQLAKALLELLTDPSRAKSLGIAASDFVRKNFSQEKMVELTERVYSGCLNLKNSV